ncbi:hypothetical protein [Commensalibacter oyaizuii]|uniref:Uncharacterized protein n=1 Tax=Commensalibacter oyaizuii TaxID=3043873 RepID=A0ABT6Q3G6_9PROT|nr:hypothetical protein [Commensalibacter sp. TBRC 16381]MDI2091663.1 hypothetical protein [Commensalibacter sp. TBRC 16381]
MATIFKGNLSLIIKDFLNFILQKFSPYDTYLRVARKVLYYYLLQNEMLVHFFEDGGIFTKKKDDNHIKYTLILRGHRQKKREEQNIIEILFLYVFFCKKNCTQSLNIYIDAGMKVEEINSSNIKLNDFSRTWFILQLILSDYHFNCIEKYCFDKGKAAIDRYSSKGLSSIKEVSKVDWYSIFKNRSFSLNSKKAARVGSFIKYLNFKLNLFGIFRNSYNIVWGWE